MMINTIKLFLEQQFHRLSLWYIGFYLIGILFYFSLSNEPELITIVFLLFDSIICLFLIKKFSSNILINFILALFISFSLGIIVSYTRTNIISPIAIKEKITDVNVSGKVSKIKPMPYGGQITLINPIIDGLDEKETPYSIRINITKMAYRHILSGDDIKLSCDLTPPPKNIVPRSYNFSQIAYFNGLGAIGKAKTEPEIIQYIDNSFLSFFVVLKKNIYEILIKKLGFKNGNIAAAMFLGETGGIDQTNLNNMRMSGIAHILCVSGLHLSTVAFIFFICSRVILNLSDRISLYYDIKKLAAYISLIFSFLYLVLTGMQIAATRAFIMTSVVIWSVIISKQPYPLRTLAFAAALILTFNPEYAIHPSFQLSFIAVLSLLVGYEFYVKNVEIIGGTIGIFRNIKLYLISNIYSSLVASLATAPIVMYHFYVYSNYSLFANLVVVPLFTMVTMPLGILSLILSPFSFSNYLFYILNLSLDIMTGTAKFIVSTPYSIIYTGYVQEFAIIIYLFSVFWISFWVRKERLIGFLGVMIFLTSFYFKQKPDIIVNTNSNYISSFSNNNLEIFSSKISPFAKKFIANWYGFNNVKSKKISEHQTLSFEINFSNIVLDLKNMTITHKDKNYPLYEQSEIYIMDNNLDIRDFSSKRFLFK
jgi:competence protein ComEC